MTQVTSHSASDECDLSVIITPGPTQDAITHLTTEVVIRTPNLKQGDDLVRMPIEIANIPTARYDGSTLKAFDQAGRLELHHEDDLEGPPILWRTWRPKRDTFGDVTVIGTALPRRVDQRTKTGPAFDLRADGEGLISNGHAFLPLPPDGEDNIRIKVEYDLTFTPQGCQGIWTGDKPAQRPIAEMAAKPSFLHNSFFIVGPVEYLEIKPPRDTTEVRHGSIPQFGMYWLKQPPFDVEQIAAAMQRTFDYMCQFFSENKKPFYRILIRHDPYPIVRSGLASKECFLISFGTLLDQDDGERSLIPALFTHEMVHNWLVLDEIETQEKSLQWYAEGLAEYYSIFFRYKQGLIAPNVVCEEANQRAQAYYTNPLATVSNEEAGKLTWKTQNAQHLAYGRGFVFFIRLDALIRDATRSKRGLDDLAAGLVQLSRENGHACTLEDFLNRLGMDIGRETAAQEFEHMASGKAVVPPENSLLPGFVTRRNDQEMFDLGFSEDSILQGPRIVRDLRLNSRAAVAGVQNGDRILSWTDLNRCKNFYDEVMKLKIMRGETEEEAGKEFDVTFWPRGWEKVESYYWKAKKK